MQTKRLGEGFYDYRCDGNAADFLQFYKSYLIKCYDKHLYPKIVKKHFRFSNNDSNNY